jgi:hypothetical protein
MKILIAATPKCGNVWLKHLLAAAYALRVVEIDKSLDDNVLNHLGDGWITHQHILPNPAMLECLRRHQVVVLTVVRHPADVLVSLKSYLHRLDDAREREETASDMLADGEAYAEHTLAYVRGDFAAQINLSLLWWRLGATMVRYEDLKRDAAGVLAKLASQLGPVSEARVKLALTLTSFSRMRDSSSKTAHHFRAGVAGGWRNLLPQTIVQEFRNRSPYPAQFAALGYSLDSEPDAELPASPSTHADPFKGAANFDNGASISDLVVQLYFLQPGNPSARWPDPISTAAPDSYFAWLNSPCDADPERAVAGLAITNLAFALYESRPDLVAAFGDVFGSDRLGFVNWFLTFARSEYRLDAAFFAPVFESVARLP